jgi:hypothetical protein
MRLGGDGESMSSGAPAFAIDPPYTGAEILAALRAHRAEAESFFSDLPLDEFHAAQGDRWSPADHLRHLTKSVRPVANALRLPRFLLGLLFGRAAVPGRAFEPLREVYQRKLADGAQAGRFTPSPRPLPTEASEQEAYRRRVMEHWRVASQAFEAEIPRWSEAALDCYRLPHPVLGKLTVREMLLFSVYHAAHHARLVAGRCAAR